MVRAVITRHDMTSADATLLDNAELFVIVSRLCDCTVLARGGFGVMIN